MDSLMHITRDMVRSSSECTCVQLYSFIGRRTPFMSKLQSFAEIRLAWQIVVCQIDSATAAGIHNHTLEIS